LTGLCAVFPPQNAPRDRPGSIRHLRNQVGQRTIIIILRLDLVLLFNNLSPQAPFHSFFVLIHSYYTHHP
jgi:hypothetical protein